jgi:hypothetical protein
MWKLKMKKIVNNLLAFWLGGFMVFCAIIFVSLIIYVKLGIMVPNHNKTGLLFQSIGAASIAVIIIGPILEEAIKVIGMSMGKYSFLALAGAWFFEGLMYLEMAAFAPIAILVRTGTFFMHLTTMTIWVRRSKRSYLSRFAIMVSIHVAWNAIFRLWLDGIILDMI